MSIEIWIVNLSGREINIPHYKKDGYTLLEPKWIVKMDLEIIDRMKLVYMEKLGLIRYSIPPAIKEEIKYTKYNRFEIMDI